MGIKTDWKEKDFVDFVNGKLSQLDGSQMIAYLESDFGKKDFEKFKDLYFTEYSKAYFKYMSKNRKFLDIDKIKDFIQSKK